MFTAFDSQNNKIWIDDSIKGKAYHCEICGCKMIQKMGEIRTHHFAHYNPQGHETHSICLDKWNYDMSEWHKVWQEKFPVECREVVIKANAEKHFADVKVGNTVIEFQHSPLSAKEFKKRNSFYKSAGNQVIWIFDVSEKELTDIEGGIIVAGWNTFRNINLKEEGITLFLDYGAEDLSEDSLQMVKSINAGTHFYDFPGVSFSVDEFVSFVMNGNKHIFARYMGIPVIVESVPGMKTIPELWSDRYKYMVVQNYGHPDKPIMIIFGNDGVIDVIGRNIVGYYTKGTGNTSDIFAKKSRSKYIVWNANNSIWKMISFKEDAPDVLKARYERKKKEKERAALQKLYADWDQAIKENSERNHKIELEKEQHRQREARALEKRHRLFPDDNDEFAEEIRRRISDQSAPVYDSIGRRWVNCCGCNLIATEGSFDTYGGQGQTNIGVCKICWENGIRMMSLSIQSEKKQICKKNPLVCPDCGGQLRLKSGKYGQFYGCSNYPSCRYTRNY